MGRGGRSLFFSPNKSRVPSMTFVFVSRSGAVGHVHERRSCCEVLFFSTVTKRFLFLACCCNLSLGEAVASSSARTVGCSCCRRMAHFGGRPAGSTAWHHLATRNPSLEAGVSSSRSQLAFDEAFAGRLSRAVDDEIEGQAVQVSVEGSPAQRWRARARCARPTRPRRGGHFRRQRQSWRALCASEIQSWSARHGRCGSKCGRACPDACVFSRREFAWRRGRGRPSGWSRRVLTRNFFLPGDQGLYRGSTFLGQSLRSKGGC